MKKIVGIVFILIGIYILSHIMLNGWSGWSGWNGWHGRSEAADSQSAEVAGVHTISVNAAAGNVEIIPVDKQELSAELHGDGTLKVERSGNEIEVTVERDGWWWLPFEKDNELQVYVPEDYNRNMDIDFHFGHFAFDGKGMDLNEFQIKMSAGDATVKNLHVGRFEEESSAGRITIANVQADEASFDVNAGEVELSDYEGGFEVDLAAGRFEADVNRLTGDVDIDLSAGEVELDLPDKADFRLKTDVNAGDFINDFGGRSGGTYGEGAHTVTIDISAGRAHLK
ncbi:MAG TPA: DUF4097 family beta strand repeat-containing protein [Bacillales bacterium]|nr:DUF4097 family beta strand repeat-containing protein [Bacillales bacterium]